MKTPRRLCISLAALAALVAISAHAAGFSTHDLTTVADAAAAALGAGYARKAEPSRITLLCSSCTGPPIVDVQLGRQDDGTEQRFRSGQTTVARLQALCREKSPTCRIDALEVPPAVGWISTYQTNAGFGSTAVVLRDGDLLSVRSLAADEQTARRNAERAVGAIAGKLVGKQAAVQR